MKVLEISSRQKYLENFFAGSFPFYSQLSSRQRRLLLENCSIHSYAPYESIHNNWERNYGFYLVIHGAIQGYAMSSLGKEFSLFAIAPGQMSAFFCDAIYISQEDNIIDFRACHNAEVVFIPQETWEELLSYSQPAALYSLQLAKQTTSVIIRSLQSFMFLSVEKKVAMHLWEKLNLQRLNDPESSIIHQTHEEIAFVLGTSRESVSRALLQFKQQGVLDTHHGKITIQDWDTLRSQVSHIINSIGGWSKE